MSSILAPIRDKGHGRVWVAAVVSGFLAMLFAGSWAIASPIGASPDDDYHLASIWCGQGFREGICESTSESSTVRVPEVVVRSSSCYAFNPDASASCAYSEDLISTDRSNASGGYPPVYYWAMSHFVGDDIDTSIAAMRLFSSLVVVCGVVAAVVIAPRRFAGIPIIGLFLTMTPLGSFLIASNNPSGWAYPAIIVFFSAMTTFLASKSRASTTVAGVLAILSVVVGAGSRADAAPYIVLALVVVWVLMWERSRVNPYSIGLSLAVIAVSAVFYLDAGQSAVLLREQGAPGFDAGNFVSNLLGLPTLWAGALGTWGLGWLDTAMPATVWLATVGLYFAVVFGALKDLDFRRSSAMALVAAALVVVPMYVLTRENIPIGVGVQPRYILPLLALLIMTAWFPSRGKGGAMPSLPQAYVMLVGLWIANAIALHFNIRRYVTGVDVRSANLDANVEWWWANSMISPMGVWVIGTTLFGALLVAVAYSFGMLTPLKGYKHRTPKITTTP
jgi:hypothetical protein